MPDDEAQSAAPVPLGIDAPAGGPGTEDQAVLERQGRRRRLPTLATTVGYEFLLTAGMLFAVVSAVRWTAAPDSPLAALLPTPQSRSVVTGLLVGAVVAAVLLPAAQRRTAGHLNPAVSIGLWLLRLFPGRAVLPFVTAQLAGSVTGTAVARFVWGDAAAGVPVGVAALAAGPGWSPGAVFAAETGCTAAIMLIVAFIMARPRLLPRLPLVVGGCVGAVIILLGPQSGGGVNPARQFGPAVVSGHTALLWVYLLAPVAGSFIAGAVAAVLRRSPARRRA